MAAQAAPSSAIQPTPARARAIERAAREWQRLGWSLRSTTPAAVGRSVLGVSVAALVFGLAAASGATLAPFVLGIVIAYACLPLTNRLAAVMPRLLAAGISVTLVVGALVLIVVIVVPPFVTGTVKLVERLPAQVASLDLRPRVDAWVATLPQPFGTWVGGVMNQVGNDLAARLDQITAGLAQAIASAILGLFNTIGFVLGLLVIPTWILVILRDAAAGRRTVDRVLPGWARADIWGVLRIADRAARAFVTVQVAGAIISGAVIYVGLVGMAALTGLPVDRNALAISVLAGLLLLIPQLGGVFVAVLAIVFNLAQPVDQAIVQVGTIVIGMRVGGLVAGAVIGRTARKVHPFIFVPALVVLGQISLLWLLISGPIVAAAVDTVRYLHGRFSEPPKPAGLLPGETLPVMGPPPERVPLVYQRIASREVTSNG
jgi:predicted PurR-regulated permease PerM